MIEKKLKAITFRTDEDNITLLDQIIENLKNSNTIDSNISRTQFLELILTYVLYDKDAKFINFKNTKLSLLEINNIKQLILNNLKKYTLPLKEAFLIDNHLNKSGDDLYLSGQAVFFDYRNDGIVIQGKDAKGTDGFFLDYPMLKQILYTYIAINEVTIPEYLNTLILNILTEEMAIYYLSDADNKVFNLISQNDIIGNKNKFYRFEAFSDEEQ
ncbi:hypothetical protein DWC20_16055 [Clostridium botulinum]|uniref:hypothetical protein n=1 Tax=Clostridium botulinum TaxID=1491 RepID=UPI000368D02C|nr:hypothetical protein [Clostridium botulinum]MBN1037049.1 hypothetical protein [Clostridium botulinum]